MEYGILVGRAGAGKHLHGLGEDVIDLLQIAACDLKSARRVRVVARGASPEETPKQPRCCRCHSNGENERPGRDRAATLHHDQSGGMPYMLAAYSFMAGLNDTLASRVV